MMWNEFFLWKFLRSIKNQKEVRARRQARTQHKIIGGAGIIRVCMCECMYISVHIYCNIPARLVSSWNKKNEDYTLIRWTMLTERRTNFILIFMGEGGRVYPPDSSGNAPAA